MQFGFEHEFFPLHKGRVISLKEHRNLSQDDCGFLLEAISEPSEDIRKAIAFLGIATDKLKEEAAAEGIRLIRKPVWKIPDEVRREAREFAGKDPLVVRNLYGHTSDPYQRDSYAHGASLQVSLSDNREVCFYGPYVKGKPQQVLQRAHVGGLFDYAYWIRGLDTAFASDIKKAGRSPGFYAFKYVANGTRVEYRSLPNNIDISRLQTVLLRLQKGQPIEAPPVEDED